MQKILNDTLAFDSKAYSCHTTVKRENIKRVIALLSAGERSGLRLLSSIVEPMTSVKIFTWKFACVSRGES